MAEKDIDNLIEDYIEGLLSDDDFIVLQDHLKNDKKALLKFVRSVKNEEQLNREFGIEKFTTQLKDKDISNVTPIKFSFKWAALAACFLAGVIALYVYQTLNDDSKKIPNNNHPMVAQSPFQIINLSGDVRFIRNGEIIPLKLTSHLFKDDVIMTQKLGKIEIKIANEETRFFLEPNSTAIVNDINGKHWILEQGVISSVVEKQLNNSSVVVKTKTAEFKVLGTRFHIGTNEHESSIHVSQGKVQMTRTADNKVVIVEKGMTASTSMVIFKPIPFVNAIDKNMVIERISLINPSTGKPYSGYESIKDGQVIKIKNLGSKKYNLLFHTNPKEVGSLLIRLINVNKNKELMINENHYPYSMQNSMEPEDKSKSVTYGEYKLKPGKYKLIITPFSMQNQQGTKGIIKELNYTVE